jgi:hypothetical protein
MEWKDTCPVPGMYLVGTWERPSTHLSVRVVSDLYYMHVPSMTDNVGRGEIITKQRTLMVTKPNYAKRIRFFGTIRLSS